MLIQQNRPVQSSQPQPPQGPANPERQSDRKEIDEDKFSWSDLGKGLAGAAIGGTVEGVGMGLSSLVRSPQVACEAIKGTWQSKMLGPVLKATLTPVILAAGLAAPVLATLGGSLYGMFEGFKEGAERNPLAAASQGVETVKSFHNDLAGQAVNWVRDLAAQEPTSPDDVLEIKLIEGGKGLLGGAASAAIVGAGVGASTLYNLPGGYAKATYEIWKSNDGSLPLKVGGQVLATAAAGLAVPLGVVGGALYGLGTGAYHGYQEGLNHSLQEAGQSVNDYHEWLSESVQVR